jgi:hypothetical protein
MDLNLHLAERKRLALERLDDCRQCREFPAFDVDLRPPAHQKNQEKLCSKRYRRRYLPDIDKLMPQLPHNPLQRVLLRVRPVVVHRANFIRKEMGARVDLRVPAQLGTPLRDGEVEA